VLNHPSTHLQLVATKSGLHPLLLVRTKRSTGHPKKVPNVARGCSVQTFRGSDDALPLPTTPTRFAYVVVKALDATLPIYFYKMRNPNLDSLIVVKALDAIPPMYFYKMRNPNLDGLHVRYLVLTKDILFHPTPGERFRSVSMSGILALMPSNNQRALDDAYSFAMAAMSYTKRVSCGN
jgi:hypothetical protein